MPTIDEKEMTPEQAAEQADLEAEARTIARILDNRLNRNGQRRRGFALLAFAFGDPPQPATWITNGEREDMIRVFEEWLKRLKSRG